MQPLALSVTFGDSSPRGRAKGVADKRLRGTCGSQSLSPFGAAPFTQGSLFSAETPNRQPHPKRRLSAQARGSLQLPRNTQPVPAKEQGRCPRGHSLLGALWFFLAARKNNNKLRTAASVQPAVVGPQHPFAAAQSFRLCGGGQRAFRAPFGNLRLPPDWRERTITLSALQKSCRQLQSAILL